MDSTSTAAREPTSVSGHVEDYNNLTIKNNIADKAPALAEIFYAAGAIVGPLIGGGLVDIYNFHKACIIFGACVGFFALIYFISSLIDAIKECRQRA